MSRLGFLPQLKHIGQQRQKYLCICHSTDIRKSEDWGLSVLIHCHDLRSRATASKMLRGA
jgi:hypothetical protein